MPRLTNRNCRIDPEEQAKRYARWLMRGNVPKVTLYPDAHARVTNKTLRFMVPDQAWTGTR